MKHTRISAAVWASAGILMLCGCDGGMPFGSSKLPDMTAGWTAQAELSYGDNTAQAEVTRSEPGCWQFAFTKPQELCGVTMQLENGKLTASLGELSVTAGEGDYTMLPVMIADGIDGISNAESGTLTDENGVLTARLTIDGATCIVTADKATGDIISFKSPDSKLAAFFSEVTPYTEEVGLIDE